MWKRYSPNELDRQFSPSLFGKLPPEETIENYYRLLPGSMFNLNFWLFGASLGHKLFSETLKCELDIQYMSGGPALDIFYPDTINGRCVMHNTRADVLYRFNCCACVHPWRLLGGGKVSLNVPCV